MNVSETLPLERYLFPDKDAAIDALAGIGGVVQPTLQMSVVHEEIGGFYRHFAVLGNVLSKDVVVPPEIREPIEAILREPANEDIRKELESGHRSYTPMNKRMIHGLIEAFQSSRVHVPWAWKAMNLDLASRISRVHVQSPFSFTAYYSQTITLYASKKTLHKGLVHPGRLFSLVVAGDAKGTWQQPVNDTTLDPDVALIIEANST
jgi:hypothetical protein